MALKSVTCTDGSKGQCGVADVQGNGQHTLMRSGGAWPSPGLEEKLALGLVGATASCFRLRELNRSTSVPVCYLLTARKSPVSNDTCLSLLKAQFSVPFSGFWATSCTLLFWLQYPWRARYWCTFRKGKESQEKWSLLQTSCNNQY